MVILASGPSLTPDQVDAVERCWRRGTGQPAALHVIAVNDSYRLAPWAEICYFADDRWWRWHKDKEEFRQFAGVKVSIEPSGLLIDDPAVYMLHNCGTSGLSDRPNGLMTGQNSAHQALNLAVLTGAQRIILLGVDLQLGERGKEHWFGSHPIRTEPAHFSSMLNHFRKAAPLLQTLGVEVWNCSPASAVDCFEKVPLHEALARLEHDPGATGLSA